MVLVQGGPVLEVTFLRNGSTVYCRVWMESLDEDGVGICAAFVDFKKAFNN